MVKTFEEASLPDLRSRVTDVVFSGCGPAVDDQLQSFAAFVSLRTAQMHLWPKALEQIQLQVSNGSADDSFTRSLDTRPKNKIILHRLRTPRLDESLRRRARRFARRRVS